MRSTKVDLIKTVESTKSLLLFALIVIVCLNRLGYAMGLQSAHYTAHKSKLIFDYYSPLIYFVEIIYILIASKQFKRRYERRLGYETELAMRRISNFCLL